ncbi:hypothetical protein D3C78_1008510 [compost metagenome]
MEDRIVQAVDIRPLFLQELQGSRTEFKVPQLGDVKEFTTVLTNPHQDVQHARCARVRPFRRPVIEDGNTVALERLSAFLIKAGELIVVVTIVSRTTGLFDQLVDRVLTAVLDVNQLVVDTDWVMELNTHYFVILERVIESSFPRSTITSLGAFLWLGYKVKATNDPHLTLSDCHDGLSACLSSQLSSATSDVVFHPLTEFLTVRLHSLTHLKDLVKNDCYHVRDRIVIVHLME